MLEITAKVHPQALVSPTMTPCYLTSKQETFTIWMKSLVLNGKGCTVYDSNGDLVYRIDNYNCKFTNRVQLMDFQGKVLFTILRKKFKLLGVWEGYKSSTRTDMGKTRPGFVVRKMSLVRLSSTESPLKVVVGLDENQPCQYKIETSPSRASTTATSTCKIVDKSGGLIAEVMRKQLRCGIVLGDDVLTMVVEPFVDHSLIMGLVVVHCLINCKM